MSPAVGAVPKVIARLLSELGDDPDRFATAAGLSAYAGTSPTSAETGMSRDSAVRRDQKGNHVNAAMWSWASTALAKSPGAMRYYWSRRASGDGHPTAVRKLGDKLVRALWHCLKIGQVWDEARLWPDAPTMAEAKAYADEVRVKLRAKDKNRLGTRQARATDLAAQRRREGGGVARFLAVGNRGGRMSTKRRLTERHTRLPGFEEMRHNALRLIGDAKAELRSDWDPHDAPTAEQAEAMTEALRFLQAARKTLDLAAPQP